MALCAAARTLLRGAGVRHYARWLGRTPARLLPSQRDLEREQVIELDPDLLKQQMKPSQRAQPSQHAQPSRHARSLAPPGLRSQQVSDATPAPQVTEPDPVPLDTRKIKARRVSALEARKLALEKENVFDEKGEILFESLNGDDGRISSLLIKLKSKKDRARAGLVLVEGWRLILDGLRARCPLKYIMFSRHSDLNTLKPHLPTKGVKIYKIPYKEIELWSDVDTPSGIFGVFSTPAADNVRREGKPLPLQIVCDNIRTPGNLGALLRAAVGVGCDNVYLTKGCVDMWDPKVLRSAAGAHFRLPIYPSLEWEQLHKLLPKNTSVFVADNNNKIQLNPTNKSPTIQHVDVERFEDVHVPVLPYYSVDYSSLSSITLIVGGETEGISEDSYRFAADRNGVRVNIPLQKGVDSLNTGMATAVIAFEIKKQILKIKIKDRGISVAS